MINNPLICDLCKESIEDCQCERPLPVYKKRSDGENVKNREM